MATGYVRDPLEIPYDSNGASVIDHIKGGVKNKFDLALVGIALACLIGEIREDEIRVEKRR